MRTAKIAPELYNYNKFPEVLNFICLEIKSRRKVYFYLSWILRKLADATVFSQRFSSFDKYDYIVGDWVMNGYVVSTKMSELKNL